MASFSGWTVARELRPCFVGAKKVKALFHCWYEDPHAGLVEVVEYENGNILKHTTKNIQFADSAGKFAAYSWGDEEKDESETLEEILRKAEVNDGK